VDAEIVGKRRISDAAAGFTQLVQLLAEAGDSAEDPIGSAPARSADYHWASVHGCGQAEAGTLRVMSRFRQSRFEAACSSRTSLTVTGMVMTASCKDAR